MSPRFRGIASYAPQRAVSAPVSARARVRASAVARPGPPPMLLWIACALVALNFGRLSQLLQAFQALPFYRLLMPVGLLALLVRRDLTKRLTVIRTPQGRALITLVAAMVLSIPFSLWRGGSFHEALHYLDAAVPLVILTAAALQSERDFAWMLRALVAAVIALCFALVAGGANLEGRLTATATYDPNDIAMVAVVALPFAVWLQRSLARRWRALGILGTVAVLVIVTRTASRGGAVALAVVIFTLLFFSRDVIPARWRLAALVLAAIGLGTAPALFWDRLRTLENPTEDYNYTAPSGRVEIWKRGIGYFVERPITGVGMGQFDMAEGIAGKRLVPEGVGFKWSAAHNMFLQTAAELGVFGLIGYLGLFLPTMRTVRRASRARRWGAIEPSTVALGQALAASIIGFMVAGFFLDAAYGPAAVTLAAMGMAYEKLVRRSVARGGAGVVAPG